MTCLKLEVLGTGCKKCQQLEANTKAAVAALGLEAELSHITDPIEIAKRGVLSTPALSVNGKVVSKGKLLSADEIQPLLQI